MLTVVSALSRDEEEFDKERDDVLFVAIDALIELSEASMLDEDSERLFELPLIVASNASTLEEDKKRLNEDV